MVHRAGDGVPGQILIPFFAKLKVYKFRPRENPFPKLSRILEKHGVRNFGVRADAIRIRAIRKAKWRDKNQTATFGPVEWSPSVWLAGPRIG